jgi:hypothetical protein
MPTENNPPPASPAFKVGDVVRIRPEWEGDHSPHVIVEWNGDRGIISPQHWPHGRIVPRELVRAEMIEIVHKPKGNQTHA